MTISMTQRPVLITNKAVTWRMFVPFLQLVDPQILMSGHGLHP
jgi:hypothetical protein